MARSGTTPVGSTVRPSNLIINGGFDYWQRNLSTGGVSHSATYTTAAAYAGPDRFRIGITGSWTGSGFASESSIVPSGTNLKTLKLYGTPGSKDTSVTFLFGQRIESTVAQACAGKTVTLSFYWRSDSGAGADQQLRVRVYTNNSTDTFNNDNLVSTQTVTPTSLGSYERYSVTFAMPSTAATGVEIMIDWRNLNTGAQRAAYFTGFMLDICDHVRPFVRYTQGDEFAACLRYYEKTFPYSNTPAQNIGASAGTVACFPSQTGANTEGGQWVFKVDKRDTPSITTYNPTAAGSGWSRAGSGDYAANIYSPSRNGVVIRINATVTIGAVHIIHATADSEL